MVSGDTAEMKVNSGHGAKAGYQVGVKETSIGGSNPQSIKW